MGLKKFATYRLVISVKNMQLVIPAIDDANYPVRAGPNQQYTVLRNPSVSYGDFGVYGPEHALRPLSDQQFSAEWELGSDNQMAMVREAAKEALGDCPGLLYQTERRVIPLVVRHFIERGVNPVRITEPGFGKSTVEMYKALLEHNISPDQVFVTGIEPSARRVETISRELEGMGIRNGQHFATHVGTDIQFLPYIRGQHLVKYTATIHHHAYNDTPIVMSYHSLAPGGVFSDSDWFEAMCMHPYLEYSFLRSLDEDALKWGTKQQDLANYQKVHPNWNDPSFADSLSPADLMAVAMIGSFWGDGWSVVRARQRNAGTFDPRDDYFYREAHGTPQWYRDTIARAGFSDDFPRTSGIARPGRALTATRIG